MNCLPADERTVSGGIAAIQSRITGIQSRFAPLEPSSAGGVLGPISPGRDADTTGSTTATSFDDVMQTALGGSSTASTYSAQSTPLGRAGAFSPSGLSGIGALDGARTPAARLDRYPRLEPPAELVAYGNGRIPKEALAEIGHGSHRLHAPAAKAFRQMEAAARADGITIGVTDSYRSYDAQVDLAKRKGLYSRGGLAATPGSSNHGWGLALDLDLDAKALAWMRQNAPDFGFVEDTPREPWHWGYRPIA